VVGPIKNSPLATAGTLAAVPKSTFQLTVTIDPVLPIVAFATQAPTAKGAGRLASAAITVLENHVNSIAAGQQIPAKARVVLSPVGPPIQASVAKGPRKVYGFVGAIIVFILLCFAIVAASEAARRRRGQELELPIERRHDQLDVRVGVGAMVSARVNGEGHMSAVERLDWLMEEVDLPTAGELHAVAEELPARDELPVREELMAPTPAQVALSRLLKKRRSPGAEDRELPAGPPEQEVLRAPSRGVVQPEDLDSGDEMPAVGHNQAPRSADLASQSETTERPEPTDRDHAELGSRPS
jgi:hypothetical protein